MLEGLGQKPNCYYFGELFSVRTPRLSSRNTKWSWSSCERRQSPCVQVPSETSLVPSGLQRRSHWTQSLQLCLRNSPCNSSREKAWQTATISLQVAKLPPTLPTTLHTQAQDSYKSTENAEWWLKVSKAIINDWFLPAGLTGLYPTRTFWMTQSSILQTLTMACGLGTTTVTENGKTALPNLLLHNRLSWL